jgi:hypothetical protein
MVLGSCQEVEKSGKYRVLYVDESAVKAAAAGRGAGQLQTLVLKHRSGWINQEIEPLSCRWCGGEEFNAT